jgi:hypothetical protein
MSDPAFENNGSEPGKPKTGRDCFGPPESPCECYCLHCGRVFMSDGMWFQKVVGARDGFDGFWMCPTPNCSGAGFTFDIFPTDPNHPANAGWSYSDDPDEDEELDPVEEAEWDPEEMKYAELDEEWGEEDDDLDGEEWKHGLEPGERPPEPAWAVEARREWEAEQRKYDEPDERPRVLDWSNREDQIGPTSSIYDDDIPF